MTTFACNFTGCEEKNLAPETAVFPSLKAIQQAESGRPVSVGTLAWHALCHRHAALVRPHVGGTFPYGETVKRIEERDAERAAARAYCQRYGASVEKPKSAPGRPAAKPEAPKNAMQLAFEKAKAAAA